MTREPCTCSPTLTHCPACLAWRTHGAATIRAILGTIEADGDEARDATRRGDHPQARAEIDGENLTRPRQDG